MEKQNERTRKFAEKAAAESSAREYELFGAAERTAKFTAYLEKVVTHAKIDYLRHMEKLNGREELAEDMSNVVEHGELPSMSDVFLFEAVRAVTLEQIATGEDLYAAILTLSPLEKEVLFHTYVEDMPPKEAARLMGLSVVWVRQVKNRALDKLLLLYEPMINRHSRIHGHVDEDLRQFIYLRILVNLKYFRG